MKFLKTAKSDIQKCPEKYVVKTLKIENCLRSTKINMCTGIVQDFVKTPRAQSTYESLLLKIKQVFYLSSFK